MMKISNVRSNKVWCENMKNGERDLEIQKNRENFIRTKYQIRKWVKHNDDYDENEIFRAARDGDILTLLRQHALGADFRRHEEGTGMTALHYAAEADSLACVAFLLRNGAEAGALNNDGFSGVAMVPKNYSSDSIIHLLKPQTPAIPSTSTGDGGGMIMGRSISSSSAARDVTKKFTDGDFS